MFTIAMEFWPTPMERPKPTGQQMRKSSVVHSRVDWIVKYTACFTAPCPDDFGSQILASNSKQDGLSYDDVFAIIKSFLSLKPETFRRNVGDYDIHHIPVRRNKLCLLS